MGRIILAIMAAVFMLQSGPAQAWDKAHCNVVVADTRAQKGQLLNECVGKFAKSKYQKILNDYKKMNKKRPDRVTNLINEAQGHLDNKHQKWLDDQEQENIDLGKMIGKIVVPASTAGFMFIIGLPMGAMVGGVVGAL